MVSKVNVNNVTLQLKLLSKIVNNSIDIWVELISKKYLKGYSIFEYISSSNCSWQCKNLMFVRDILRKVRVGLLTLKVIFLFGMKIGCSHIPFCLFVLWWLNGTY